MTIHQLYVMTVLFFTSEWLLFNANTAIFQQYHGKISISKLRFLMWSWVIQCKLVSSNNCSCIKSIEKRLLHIHVSWIKKKKEEFRRYHIGGVMVSVLASSVVDHGREPRLFQAKDYKIDICWFSTKHAALRSKIKDWLAQNQTKFTLYTRTNLLTPDFFRVFCNIHFRVCTH
jgi:hypothetical protein